MNDKSKIVDEHFWFTATTLGVNGFLMASNLDPAYSWLIRALSTFVTFYAVFLIVHRSAAHADKIEKELPDDLRQVPQTDRTWKHKLRETGHHWRIVFKHIPFVICEFSGALFYTTLVVVSCAGVWLSK